MVAQLQFRILGPLEVSDGERIFALGGNRQRGLLALLLLSANQVVSADRLIDELWSERPPRSGRGALQVRVSQLHKALGKPESCCRRAHRDTCYDWNRTSSTCTSFERLVEDAKTHDPAAASKLRGGACAVARATAG